MSSQIDSRRGAGKIRRAVLLGLFVGTGVGVGYLLSGIPNVELVTLVCALAGGALGPRLGMACGALVALIFSLGNPYGMAVPLVLGAQVIGLAVAGGMGGLAAPALLAQYRSGNLRRSVLLSLVMGLTAVVIFDVLTNLAAAVAFALDWRVMMVGAVPFSLLHLASNLPLFAVLFPWLLPRCHGLARQPLRGLESRSALLVLSLLLVSGGAQADPAEADSSRAAAPAAPDSLTAVPDSVVAARPAAAGPDSAAGDLPAAAASDPVIENHSSGTVPPEEPELSGHHPYWEPFPVNLFDSLSRYGPWLPLADGGFGARVILLGEPATSPVPSILRDGIPLGTGHRWTDDPWLVALAGQEIEAMSSGLGSWEGSAGEIRLRAEDAIPGQTVTDGRFFKGPHETYLRSLSFRTPRAPWRLRFDFEEVLDQQGYNFSVPGDDRYFGVEALGESKYRCGRGTVSRLEPDGGWFLSISTLRKHKKGIPSLSLDHEEVWGSEASLRWRDRTPGGELKVALFWSDRDVERDFQRKLEMTREGLQLQLSGGRDQRRHLRVMVRSWRLHDTGADTTWAGPEGGEVHGRGQDVSCLGALPWFWHGLEGELGLTGRWESRAGWQPDGRLTLRPLSTTPWLQMALERGGRAPRSDELLTSERVFVPGRSRVLLANPDLKHEQTSRASVKLAWRLWGTDLALTGSAHWLRDGITWAALPEESDRGRWENGLGLDSQTVRASVARAGRLAGWLRLRLTGVWQRFDVREGTPAFLPPESYWRTQLLWEHRFFNGDGILEFGYWFTHRSELPDPWFPLGEYSLPAANRHDLIMAFRLLGADLSLALRNLTDDRVHLASGALSDGREMRWRLHWTFSQ